MKTGVITSLRHFFANKVAKIPFNECNGDFSPTRLIALRPYPMWRKLELMGGTSRMGRSSELFVVAALLLLAFSFITRFINPSVLGLSFPWRGMGYTLPPAAISVGLATAMYFFATIYSLWMLPFSRTATLWHFWLTTIAIGLFWLALYQVPNSKTAVWRVFAALAAVLLTQLIFVWNLIQAMVRMPKPPS